MKAYHEVSTEDVATILKHGLKKTSRGDKGDDKVILATDAFLDEHCPDFLKTHGLSRDDNIYAYVRNGDSIVTITDGKQVPIKVFVKRSKDNVLELTIDPSRCYVSDLDAYDALKHVILHEGARPLLTTLAYAYWSKLKRLDQYTPGSIKRPELMITYDIEPDNIKLYVG